MKKNILIIIAIIQSFLLTSCLEFNNTTKVNSDGTCERTIAVNSDEKNPADSLKLLESAGWNVTVKYNSADKKYFASANKKYNSYTELENDAAAAKPVFHPAVTVKIDKSFKFFFTYYSYRETYKAYMSNMLIPIEKYFTPQDIEKLKSGKDSAWVKEKMDIYFEANIIAEALNKMEEYFLAKEKIKIFSSLTEGQKKALYKDLLPISQNRDEIYAVFAKYYNKQMATAAANYLNDNKELHQLIENKFKSKYDANYSNSIILPGIITSSNSNIIEGNKVSWNFDQNKFQIFELVMEAESREVNMWVIIISGLVVVVLVTGLILSKSKKK